MNTIATPYRACTVLALIFAFSEVPVSANDNIPFVIGHERFGRHAEVDSATSGRLLITELSCTACHPVPGEDLKSKNGPSLAGAGVRLQQAWIERYLESPASVDRGTTMPDMLSSLPKEQRATAARALASYLVSLVEPFPEPKATGANPVPLDFSVNGDSVQGRRLFHTIGCVACHEPFKDHEVPPVQPSDLDRLIETLDPDELKELGLSSAARKVESIPLPVLAEKYSRQSLTYFLLYPDHVRPSSRMPSFSLKPVEAADIAAYLIPNSGTKSVVLDKKSSSNSAASVATGKRLFTELRCANCHTVSDRPVATPVSGKVLASLRIDSKNSCVSVKSATSVSLKRGQPTYQLDESQFRALGSALNPQAISESQKKRDLSLTLMQLNCFACHERGDLGGIDRYRKPYFETVNNIDIGDEGRLPPTLTSVGRRLSSTWMESVLKGEGVIRPHMSIRMPVYNKSYTKLLPPLFESQDRLQENKPTSAFVKADPRSLVDAGRKLMDSGCIQCHKFRGNALPGVVGVDLMDIEKRVQPQWLHDFLLDPASLKKRTRMPSFFPEGKSQNPDILNGDVELQLAAMAAYLSDLKNQPLPQKIEEARSQNFELVPKEVPTIVRTFMPVGGLHSIAVGFPEKWHFAFDSARCSIAEGWQGKFLDAETTWFDRFARPTPPLGNRVVQFPSGPSVAVLPKKNSPWPASESTSTIVRFRGYELDESGIPSFRYETSQYEVQDKIQPASVDGEVTGLRRTLTAKRLVGNAPPDQLWFRALVDKRPSQVSSRPANSKAALVTSEGLTVVLMSDIPHGEVRKMAEAMEWIVPFAFEGNELTSVEMLYQWK